MNTLNNPTQSEKHPKPHKAGKTLSPELVLTLLDINFPDLFRTTGMPSAIFGPIPISQPVLSSHRNPGISSTVGEVQLTQLFNPDVCPLLPPGCMPCTVLLCRMQCFRHYDITPLSTTLHLPCQCPALNLFHSTKTYWAPRNF